MNGKNNKAVILIFLGVALVVIGLGITLFVLKKPFTRKGEERESSEIRKVIQLDVPGQTSEEIKKVETGEDEVVPDTTKDTIDKDIEKASEKKTVTTAAKKEVASEKSSEKKKEDQQPLIIVEDPKLPSAPTTTTTTTPTPPADNDDAIELPFVPYEEIKEN